jgi:small-conductance mechanosensitive channel
MTDVAHRFIPWAPAWAPGLAVLILGVLLAWAAHALLWRWLTKVTTQKGLFLAALVERTKGPTRLALILLTAEILIDLPELGLSSPRLARPLQIALIVLIGWSCVAALHVSTVIYSRRFKLETDDNLIARRHVTQIRILERTAVVFIVMLTLAAALMTMPAVRQYGISLLASAGAAGIIAGLALQPLLTNLIAGVQIAITQPIRIDDAVIVQDEWGWIEEIGATYVTVRLWDWRRLILPLSYFIQQPFQNWTRESSNLIGTAMFYLDYNAPVEAMREKLNDIVKATPKWDKNVVNLQVTDLTEHTMQVRCLASARNAGETFDLRCIIREEMIAFLKAEHPYALPQNRLQMDGGWPPPEQRPANGNGAGPVETPSRLS